MELRHVQSSKRINPRAWASRLECGDRVAAWIWAAQKAFFRIDSDFGKQPTLGKHDGLLRQLTFGLPEMGKPLPTPAQFICHRGHSLL